MINLYTQVERLKQISEVLLTYSYDDIEFFSSCVYSETPGSFLSDHYFGFDHNGVPVANSHSDISISITHHTGRKRVVVRNLPKFPVISVTFKNSLQPDQIFYSNGFGATPLGRNYTICKDRHPELYITEEDASYAALLGKDVFFHLPEYIKLLEPIIEFALMADTIQKEKFSKNS